MIAEKMNNTGFSLIEIVVVLIISSALAGVAIVNYQPAVERLRANEADQMLLNILQSQRRYALDTGSYANNLNDLDIEVPSLQYFNAPVIQDANPLAILTRKDGSYNLRVAFIEASQTVRINCNNLDGGNLCEKMKYPKIY